MKFELSTMMTPRALLAIVCAVLVYGTGKSTCAPTDFSNKNSSVEVGANPEATIAPPTIVPSLPSNDDKNWPLQKPYRSKHIIKSSLYKKPSKDKGGLAKLRDERPHYSPTLATAGYDEKKDNLKEAPSTVNTNPIDTVVDNVNGPNDYTNKITTNSFTLRHSIYGERAKSVFSNIDDDVNDDDANAGKDIDFISVVPGRTTKADKTYASGASTTEGYHAKAGVATTATMQTGLVENPNFNAEPIPKTSSSTERKSLFRHRMTPTPEQQNKSLPVHASVSSSFSQYSVSTTTTSTIPKLDVGHDGVKITKKKQLFDKHFIAATGPSSSLHPPISKDNPWPLSKNKLTKGGKKLMEVPNGYLGPIIMKEKTFSVSHHGKKPKPSIAEQLRDKKLVEIIAPTALMEPTIKVKSSTVPPPPPPEFVPIDSTSAVATSTTSTTTEGTSTLPPVPTVLTAKQEGIESETATTYFLVVTQDAESTTSKEANKPPVGEAMSSGEMETTLREIYKEVISAMEGAAKKQTASTESPLSSTIRGSSVSDVEKSAEFLLTTASDDVLVSVTNPSLSTAGDRILSSGKDNEISDQQRSKATDRVVSTDSFVVADPFPDTTIDPQYTTDFLTSTVIDQHRSTPVDHSRSSATDEKSVNRQLQPTTIETFNDHQDLSDHKQHESTTEDHITSSSADLDSINHQLKPTPVVPFNNPRPLPDHLTSEATPPPTDVQTSTTDRAITATFDNFRSKAGQTVSDATNQATPAPITSKDSTIQDTVAISDHVSMISDRTSTSSPVDLYNSSTGATAEYDSDSILTLSRLMGHASTVAPISEDVATISDGSTKLLYHDSKNANHVSPIVKDYAPISDPSTPFTENISSTTDRSSTFAHHDSSLRTSSTVSPITRHDMSPIAEDLDRSSTFSHHDSSAGTSSTPFTTIHHSAIADHTTEAIPITEQSTFLPITTTSPTLVAQHLLKPTHDSEQTESKISDIQIEVYDSTLEPILASTNFKDNVDVNYIESHATTKEAPIISLPQERFTQYVVDKATDFATPDSNAVARASGKPEPAAIEIHINVSEGFGNESEDLEFSYRQSDYRKVTSKKPANSNFITLKPFDAVPQNETSNEAAEEIVVEIIDGSSNSTENSASRENLNVNPIFTFRSDDDSQVEIKNVKYYPEDRPKERTKSTDDFFVPHVGQQPPDAKNPSMDRDSDTIFYISNTEVKVGESLPTTNTYDAQMKKSRLESQFFPANYEERKVMPPQRYEEDIILSPAKNRLSDPLKVVRRPLDISYVGESVMEIEQVTVTTTVSPFISTPDVIIQPAVLPEMAIGVPVIGELPPQIELKEIDFMPNFDGNKEESSIQYGGDLIDEGGAMGAGFDMDSYPLGNMGLGQRSNDATSSQMVLNHHVNHLKKDELSADLPGSSETADGNDLIRRSNDSANGTVIGEKMGNATAYSVMDEAPAGDGEFHFSDLHTLFTACLATLLPLIFSVALAFGLRHLYRKYRTNPFNVMGRNSSTDPLDAEKGTGGDGDVDGIETPEELRASSLAFGASTTDSPSLEICTNSNEVKRNASNGDGRDCNGCVANGRAQASDIDVDCIQTIIPDDVLEENATFIVNCNIETQPMAAPAPSPTVPPQSTITTNAATVSPLPTAGTMQSNYSGPNGSITTMTLKNNHLIVETEERNDISRDARETKMHYNNGEKDGVFVVEVSRGADSKIMPGSPVDGSPDKRPFNIDAAVKIIQSDEDKLMSCHEEVQVHPPPPENVNILDEIESNHLHQIDEVDEFEEGPRIAKHSNTGLSQSDLSSSSSLDSNKRYSYGNQELYTIEQQDYTTPSPAATKAPHPHTQSQPPQPENHNDDNGHSENSHCPENEPPATPNCDTIQPGDTDLEANEQGGGVESKPKITAALLKQDTIIANEMTNGLGHGHDEPTPHNGVAPAIKTCKALADCNGSGDTENGFDSIISLPDPPSTEEMKQMNDIILMETNQLDSLPPPPPPGAAENHHHHNGNGSAAAEPDTENGDSHSIVSSSSPMNTPTKVAPPTITVLAAASSAPTDIPHTNGNCMTGHTTTVSTAAVVEVSGSS